MGSTSFILRQPVSAGGDILVQARHKGGWGVAEEVCQGETGIGDQYFVLVERTCSLFEQAGLQRRFGFVCFLSQQIPQEGQSGFSDGADVGDHAEDHCRQSFACLGGVMLAHLPMQMRAKEAHQITGDGMVTFVSMPTEVSLCLDTFSPGGEKLRQVPFAIPQCGAASPDGLFGKSGVCERGKERSSAGKEASGEQSKEKLKQTEIGSDRDPCQNLEQAAAQSVKSR